MPRHYIDPGKLQQNAFIELYNRVGVHVVLRHQPCDFKGLGGSLRAKDFANYAQRFSSSVFDAHRRRA